jgi:BioD-like phosphotransacetylase family protein
VEGSAHGAIERVLIGTVASDAASPYFAARERKCVVTRYDKTDIQLAALLTDLELLVLTGGGEPSPYLLDRVASERNGVSVLVAEEDTVDAMRAIEGLYMRSRFEGQGKLERAVALLDEAGFSVDF